MLRLFPDHSAMAWLWRHRAGGRGSGVLPGATVVLATGGVGTQGKGSVT